MSLSPVTPSLPSAAMSGSAQERNLEDPRADAGYRPSRTT